MNQDARSIAHAYFQSWTQRRFRDAVDLLDPAVSIEAPINAFPTRDSFAQALAGFGSMVERVELLSELGNEAEALQLYDLEVVGLGALRVAEHFTIRGGKIVRLRQIHDTATLRAAGFGA